MIVTLSAPDSNDPHRKQASYTERKIADDFFKRGAEAMKRQDWDYVCQMIRTAVDLVPEVLLYRGVLRRVTEKRYRHNGTGAAMASMKLRPTKASIKKCGLQSDWKSIAKLCEDGLAINPWDQALHSDLGNALRLMGYEEVAVWCFHRAGELE